MSPIIIIILIINMQSHTATTSHLDVTYQDAVTHFIDSLMHIPIHACINIYNFIYYLTHILYSSISGCATTSNKSLYCNTEKRTIYLSREHQRCRISLTLNHGWRIKWSWVSLQVTADDNFIRHDEGHNLQPCIASEEPPKLTLLSVHLQQCQRLVSVLSPGLKVAHIARKPLLNFATNLQSVFFNGK